MLVHLEWRREQVGIFKKTQRSKKNIKFGKCDPTWPQDNWGCHSALREAQNPGGGGWLLHWAQADIEESQPEQGGGRMTLSGTQTGTQPLYRWDCRNKKLWGQRLSTLKCDAWNGNIKTGSWEPLSLNQTMQGRALGAMQLILEVTFCFLYRICFL